MRKKRAKHDGFSSPCKGKIPRLRILGNQEMSEKSQNFIKLQASAQSCSQNENFVGTSKKPLENRN